MERFFLGLVFGFGERRRGVVSNAVFTLALGFRRGLLANKSIRPITLVGESAASFSSKSDGKTLAGILANSTILCEFSLTLKKGDRAKMTVCID